MTAPNLTFGSLFAGIGGIDLGFERAGLVCKWQVEIDDYATRVLAKHWPNVRRHNDVCTWPAAGAERVDVIAGGFPCQDISYAGKGAGLQGARSGLFYEAIRIIREMGPRFVVLENVSALLTRGLDSVLGTLASLGYDAEWDCIEASSFGAPQRRERVFVMAYPNGLGRKTATSEKVLAGEVVCKPEGWRGSRPNVLEFTGVHGKRSRLLPPSGIRRMDDGVPANMDRLRGLGNAVVPQVAEWIGHRLVELSSAVLASTTEEKEK